MKKRCPQCNKGFWRRSFTAQTTEPSCGRTFFFILPSESSLDAWSGRNHHYSSRPDNNNWYSNSLKRLRTRPKRQLPTPTTNAVPVVIEKKRSKSTGRYLFFCLSGLILGGGFVLARGAFGIFFISNKTKRRQMSASRPRFANKFVQNTKSPIWKRRKQRAQNTKTPHRRFRRDEFNGRADNFECLTFTVVNRNSKETDVLLIDDRLNIEEREKRKQSVVSRHLRTR